MRKQAFTLAEVLITLGIIGVVAALTIPTLIANHKKQEVVTKLKKVYTVMNQAINLSVSEYGDIETWAADCGTYQSPKCTPEEAIQWFNTYIGKHLQITNIEKSKTNNKVFDVYFTDGSILEVGIYLYDMNFFMNKKALLNGKFGKNAFAFRFNPVLAKGQIGNNQFTTKSTFEPYMWQWDGTREGLLDPNNGYSCGQIYSNYCTKLIQYEGWSIPKDYPFKF